MPHARAQIRPLNLATRCEMHDAEPARIAGPRLASLNSSRFRDRAAGTTRALPGGTMKDVILVAVSVGFFAIAWVYARSFDRL
jgi:hypothetical protein